MFGGARFLCAEVRKSAPNLLRNLGGLTVFDDILKKEVLLTDEVVQ